MAWPWLVGCSSDRADGAPAAGTVYSDDALAAVRAADRALLLLGLAAAEPPTAPYPRLAADHRAHLVALGQVGEAAGATASRPTAAQHVAAERDGAAEALGDLVDVSPALAVLLTRIAAGRSVHADLLAARHGLPEPDGPAAGSPAGPLDPAGRSALAALIRGEHAADFGYGVITAWVAEPDRIRANRIWADHRARRDRYSAALLAAGGLPPAALPAYDVGAVSTAAAAAALAGRIEAALLTSALNALAQVDGDWRQSLAADAVQTTRRQEGWAGPVPALPGAQSPAGT